MPWGYSFSNLEYPINPCTPFLREKKMIFAHQKSFLLQKGEKRQQNQHPYYEGDMSKTCFGLSLVHCSSLGVCGT
jgi:hypothetical protein